MPHRPKIPITDITGRVIRSQRQVEFTDCDPYRHVSAPAYFRMAVDHRFTAVARELGIDAFDLPETTGIAYPIRHAEIDFQQSAILGDLLTIESWVDRVFPSRMEVKVRITRAESSALCCALTLTIVAVEVKGGAPVPFPTELPSSQPVDFAHLPWADGHPRNG